MSASVEEILSEAAKREKEYEWLQASELYKQTLGMVDEEDHFRRGEIQEKIGYSLRRAAFQAESREEFREKMLRAVEAYERAHDLYEKLADGRGAPWMLRCRAISRDLSHWLASDPSEKRRLLDECLELEDKALAAFWDLGDKLEYGRTYNELPLVHYNLYILEWDRPARERILEKAIEWGEKAVAVLSELSVPHELARASCTVNLYLGLIHIWHVAETEKQEQHRLKDIERFRKTVELSERVGDAYLVGLTHWNWGWNASSEDERIQQFKKALECGEETRDIFLKGIVHDYLAYRIHWKVLRIEDPHKRLKLAEEAMEFYDKGQQHLSVISYLFRQMGIILAPGGYAEHYHNRARWETDLEKKLEFLEKAEKDGLKAFKIAEDSDIPSIIDQMCHYLSKTLQARASLEPETYAKRSLLDKAIKYRKRSIEIEERLFPYNYWRIGVWYNYLALIKMEYADVEPDLKDKRRLLEDAVQSMEKCLESINKIISIPRWGDMASNVAVLSRCQGNYEVILTRLYKVTNEQEYLRKAIDISRKVIESARKADMNSRIAESYWKIARKHDILGEELEAADSFRHASESYMKAAEKMPQLKGFYQDHAAYMMAWSRIERARHHHKEKKYGKAKEHYEKAAELHETTERWGYLSPNYQAWAHLEGAEDLSRREQTEEAKDLFNKAAELFAESRESLKAKLHALAVGEERQFSEEMIEASDERRGYCLGRVALEEARILDMQGDHQASSSQYDIAAKAFQGFIDSNEEARVELEPLVYLCMAWSRMTQAEAEASPELYLEASQLFEKAKDSSHDEGSKRLALGHSLFCLALEAGARFENTRDVELYTEAVRYLGSAAVHYMRAGNNRASEYAKATQRLFDAYIYMDNAQVEMDPQRKAQQYRMAERTLEYSAGSFLSAMHPEKSGEVQGLLAKVRDEREWALSLIEVTHAPMVVTNTEAFVALTSTRETAVGLERFEHADVQANLVLSSGENRVGGRVELGVELVNAGKEPSQLLKIGGIIPDGFEVVEVSDTCIVEDGALELKGRILPPLKLMEVRLVLRPMSPGSFTLRPRVHYLDETGNLKSFLPDPLVVEIAEVKKLTKGKCYFYASREACFRAFTELTETGVRALAIVRDDPERLRMEYGFNVEKAYVLSASGFKGVEALPDLQVVSRTMSRRLEQGVGVILLDGLEYLIARFSFEVVFGFLQEMRFKVLEAGALMLIPFNLETVSGREGALLKSELEMVT